MSSIAWPPASNLVSKNILLEPLGYEHEEGLREAVLDGKLWALIVTSAPEPDQVKAYIDLALTMRQNGSRLAYAVIQKESGRVIGCTSYHDVMSDINRVEIGYTWYAKSVQKTYVNTECKNLLLEHAFETLDCNVVGWRTDHLNFASQKAIERLGAKKDGVIRCNALRRDGTIRDTVMYSILKNEWYGGIKAHLQQLLHQYN